MRPTRLLIATLLTASALAGVGLSNEAAHAAGSTTLNAYPSKPMKNEKVTYVGMLTTPVARRVVLQYRTKHDGWKYYLETKSETGSGYFSVSRAATRTRTVRFYAPKATVDGKKYASITGRARKVSVVGQTASLIVSPATQCLGQNETIYAIASFTPVRPDRPVVFQTPVGPVAGTQDDNGRLAIEIGPGGSAGTFGLKATTGAVSGAAAKSTPTASYTVYGFCP